MNLRSQTTEPRPSFGWDSLSETELQVSELVARGYSNKEIAERIQVSESAVKSVLQQLFNKTGVRNRSQLVRIALEQFQDQLEG